MKIKNLQKPLTIIVFGATGDLYQKKLSLALFNLFSAGLLPKDFKVIGFARRPLSDSEFRIFTKEAILQKVSKENKDNKTKLDKFLLKFLLHLNYVQGDLENLQSFKELSQKLGVEDRKKGVCSNKLFYLSVPPTFYEIIFKNINKAGLTIPCASGVGGRYKAWTRVLVEKPFGKDLAGAKRLDKMLGELFDESQIFRIDHYLGKSTMQNILDFRFKNKILEHLWNNKNIEKVKIIFHEAGTILNRGNFYDDIGALRDIGQNHMLQMLAVAALEDPGKKDIHHFRREVLEKVKLYKGFEILRGQYEGYRETMGVDGDSTTETFFYFTLEVKNKRWQGVPFEFEAGKALAKSEVFIEVCFKDMNACVRFMISGETPVSDDAYAKVFYDCILGDQTIFVSTREVMAEWRLVEDVIKAWKNKPVIIYEKGKNGESIK